MIRDYLFSLKKELNWKFKAKETRKILEEIYDYAIAESSSGTSEEEILSGYGDPKSFAKLLLETSSDNKKWTKFFIAVRLIFLVALAALLIPVFNLLPLEVALCVLIINIGVFLWVKNGEGFLAGILQPLPGEKQLFHRFQLVVFISALLLQFAFPWGIPFLIEYASKNNSQEKIGPLITLSSSFFILLILGVCLYSLFQYKKNQLLMLTIFLQSLGLLLSLGFYVSKLVHIDISNLTFFIFTPYLTSVIMSIFIHVILIQKGKIVKKIGVTI